MSMYTKVAVACAAVLLLEAWNFRRAKRSGRIFLGGVDYGVTSSPKSFKMAIVMNLVWTGLVVVVLAYCCLKAAGKLN